MVPVLETARLLLRPLTWDDRPTMHRLEADPEAMRFVAPPRSAEEADHLLGQSIAQYDALPEGMGRWAVQERATGTFIGVAVLRPREEYVEVGYRLFPAFWGHGYATEITRQLLHHGLQTLRLPLIAGVTDPHNVASQHVLEKCGFQFLDDHPRQGKLLRHYLLENPNP